MLIEQIIEFQLRGASGRTCATATGYFHDKTKVSTKILRLLFTAKILQQAMYRTYRYLSPITYKI